MFGCIINNDEFFLETAGIDHRVMITNYGMICGCKIVRICPIRELLNQFLVS